MVFISNTKINQVVGKPNSKSLTISEYPAKFDTLIHRVRTCRTKNNIEICSEIGKIVNFPIKVKKLCKNDFEKVR